jgi:hypothetical protein
LDHIYKINADLHRLLIIHSDHVVEPLQPTVMKTTKTYARIRKHAIKLHDVFQEKFHTEHGCPDIPHNVDLPLQRVSADEKGHDSEAVKLRVLFSLDIWNEIEFELVDCPEYAHATTRDVVVGSNDGKSGTGAVRWAGLGGGVVEGGNTEP